MSPSTHPFLYHLTGKVICQCSGLDHDVSLGVLELVPVGEPVTWCHLMVICAKKNGKPRWKVDFRALNFHATWETHHTQSPFHQACLYPVALRRLSSTVGTATTVFPFTQTITTFITPWGQYKMAPQGYIASGDDYSRRFDEIVSGIPNKTKCINDTLLWGDNLTKSFFQAV